MSIAPRMLKYSTAGAPMVTKTVNRVDLKADILLPSSLPIVVSGPRMLGRTRGSFTITQWSVRVIYQDGWLNNEQAKSVI